MACVLLWSSAVRVHDSQAYRKMDVTRERISRILELREILLSIQIVFSFVNAAGACAILQSNSGLEPSSVITEPSYLNPFQLVLETFFVFIFCDAVGNSCQLATRKASPTLLWFPIAWGSFVSATRGAQVQDAIWFKLFIAEPMMEDYPDGGTALLLGLFVVNPFLHIFVVMKPWPPSITLAALLLEFYGGFFFVFFFTERFYCICFVHELDWYYS